MCIRDRGNRFRDLFHVEGNGCEEKIFEANCFGNIDKGFWGNIQRGRWMTNNVLNWRYDRLGSRASICGANDGWGGGAINWKFAEKMLQNDGDCPRRKATFLTPDEFLYDSRPVSYTHRDVYKRQVQCVGVRGSITGRHQHFYREMA